ncbi:MerR family transcriptional regulator [Streptomyces collinus]|uniref:MerR family transcriptional regulator n=1 Tax=Streptomyces collinus TaxID=42684 RepID=UPI0033A63517
MTDGVTIHHKGLIDEPARDRSAYRRYGTADLLRLVQIRTLAGAGVPLAEIDALLDADPDRFAAALAAAEESLTSRIEELIARRETLRLLAHGDRVDGGYPWDYLATVEGGPEACWWAGPTGRRWRCTGPPGTGQAARMTAAQHADTGTMAVQGASDFVYVRLRVRRALQPEA